MIRKFKGRKAFVIVLAIVLTIALIPTTSFAGTGQEQARIHLDQSIGGNGDTLIITSPQGTYESSIKGGGKNITVDMDTFENLFDFKGQSTLDVTYTNATTGATGTLTLKHQEGHATGTMDEPDNGLNNFRGTVTPTPTGNEPTGNEPTGDEPTGNEPTGNEPTGDEPTGNEPTGNEPTGNEPTGNEPTGNEPTGNEPTGNEPTGNEPTGNEPTGNEPTGDEPTGNEPTGDEPTGNEPTNKPRKPRVNPTVDPVVEIVEEEVPLAEIPEVEIPEEEVPLAEAPLVEIPEEEVPLADVPKTGDNMIVWAALAILSLLGITAIGRRRADNN